MTCILFIVHHKSIIITVTTFVTILDTINVSSDLVIVVMLMLWEPYGEIRSNTVLETKIVESSMRRDRGGGKWGMLKSTASLGQCLFVGYLSSTCCFNNATQFLSARKERWQLCLVPRALKRPQQQWRVSFSLMLSHQANFTVYVQILRQIWRYDMCDIRRNEEMHRAPRDTHRNLHTL